MTSRKDVKTIKNDAHVIFRANSKAFIDFRAECYQAEMKKGCRRNDKLFIFAGPGV